MEVDSSTWHADKRQGKKCRLISVSSLCFLPKLLHSQREFKQTRLPPTLIMVNLVHDMDKTGRLVWLETRQISMRERCCHMLGIHLLTVHLSQEQLQSRIQRRIEQIERHSGVVTSRESWRRLLSSIREASMLLDDRI